MNSNYNSLAAKLQQRFSRGVSYLVSYTYSKSIDDGSAVRPHGGDQAFPQNPYNLRAERGLSEFDQRHRLVTSALWDLPTGKGRQWLNEGGPFAYILGGWQLGGIFTAQSGLPFSPASGADVANIAWAEQRPNYTGAPIVPPGGRTTNQWFNKVAFAIPPAFTFGNAGRDILLGPRLFSVDFSATKQFLMPWEGHQLQLRFEAFNLLNHPNFGFPSATITDTAFGRISSTATDMRQIQFALKYTF
ncbi:MAG: hypothetical protein ACR2I2_04900 [Bryobacteraceae bacterium]